LPTSCATSTCHHHSRDALTRIPVTRKSELLERQKAKRQHDAFGGFPRWCAVRRCRASLRRPARSTNPRARARLLARRPRLVRRRLPPGELVHNSFSYHMTPGAFILESGAHAVGCTVFPAGTGQTEQQLRPWST
jgi:phenylacetate-CoA ligase